jgi:hypothetical protein
VVLKLWGQKVGAFDSNQITLLDKIRDPPVKTEVQAEIKHKLRIGVWNKLKGAFEKSPDGQIAY